MLEIFPYRLPILLIVSVGYIWIPVYIWMFWKIYDMALKRGKNPYLWIAIAIVITPVLVMWILYIFWEQQHTDD